ncbi:MAG: class I SAM-dependent methyltransferase [Desulfovibrio sp.]|jgi:16S rRNA (guanine527-N7)-methyltransferase|nr:class I SAM-dependent methyltransferase [Desulfovibrio sp.]
MSRRSPDYAPAVPEPEAVRLALKRFGFFLPDAVLPPLCAYLDQLGKWKKVANLTGPGDWLEILGKLVLDSFHLAPFLDSLDLPSNPLCLDLGAGAGLPGLPLRMLRPVGPHVLVEAREKRALFLRAFLAAHPLPGTSVFHGRAEDCLRKCASAGLILSRAFKPWAQVLEMAAPHMQSGSFCVFLSLEPLPEIFSAPRTDAFLEDWTGDRQASYIVGGKARYFWALRKI